MVNYNSKRNNEFFPDPPACYSEAAKLAKQLCMKLKPIKKLMEMTGHAPAHYDDDWVVPMTEGEVCGLVQALSIDVQMIENLLLYHGLADETEFIPLEPRWRIDPVKHHNRNWKVFEFHVRDIITAVGIGMDECESLSEFYEKFKRYFPDYKDRYPIGNQNPKKGGVKLCL